MIWDKLILWFCILLPLFFLHPPALVEAAGARCVRQVTPCGCFTATSWVNLSPLDSRDKRNPRFHAQDFQGNSYGYNPCSPYSFPTGCTDVASCKEMGTGTPIGTQETATFTNDPGTGDLILGYTQPGTPRILKVKLVCDQGQEGQLSALGEGPINTFDHTLTTRYACEGVGPEPRPPASGLSTGSVMLIIFFVLVVVYIVGGILVSKYYLNLNGWEVIPHREFWRSLPSLAWDGVTFTYQKLRTLLCVSGSATRSGYDEI